MDERTLLCRLPFMSVVHLQRNMLPAMVVWIGIILVIFTCTSRLNTTNGFQLMINYNHVSFAPTTMLTRQQRRDTNLAFMRTTQQYLNRRYIASFVNIYKNRPYQNRILLHSTRTTTSRKNATVNDDTETITDTELNEATLRSVTFSNLPKDQEPNLLCELLMECGACATWITDADRYTDMEEPLFNEPPMILNTSNNRRSMNSTNINELLSIPWIAPIWNRCNVTALFPASVHIPSTILTVQEVFSGIIVTETTTTNDDEEKLVDTLSTTTSSSNINPSDSVDLVESETSTISKYLESYSIETVPSKDWVTTVQQSWNPIIVANKFLLHFPWHTNDTIHNTIQEYKLQQQLRNSSDTLIDKGNNDDEQFIPILLQGGIAFGTGEHATTQLCLEWLYNTVMTSLSQSSSQNKNITILDYGTGSGVLGIAGCAIGRQYQQQQQQLNNSNNDDGDINPVSAIGIDIDIDACQIANMNAMLNGNLPMQSYIPSLQFNANNNNNNTDTFTMDSESQSLLYKAHYKNNNLQQTTTTTDGSMNEMVIDLSTIEPFDICVANILAGPLIVLAPILYQYMKHNSMIGMSGILYHQKDIVIHAYESIGFTNVHVTKELRGWVLISAQKP